MVRDDIEVGVLGVGHIGSVHLQTATTLDGVTVSAAADAVPANRRRAERLGARRTYADYEELLAEEAVDVVVVALPPSMHADAAVSATEAGAHVFVEKPLARSVEEARTVVDAADRAGVRVGVDHTLRYYPEMRALKRRYDDGRLGHVPLAHLVRVNAGPFETPPPTGDVPDWQLDPAQTGGGAVMDLGVHLLDLLEWLFGEMTVVDAVLDRQLDLPYEDTALLTLRSEATGTLASVHCGFYHWEEPPDVTLRCRLEGIADTADSTDFAPNFHVNAARSALTNTVRRATGGTPEYFGPTYHYRAHYEALAGFVEAVGDGEDPPVGEAEALRSLRLVEAAYDAAREGDAAGEAAERRDDQVRAHGGSR